MGEYNLISPIYYLLKYSWYYYRLKSARKPKTIIVEQTYNKEEDYVHLEMTEIPI
jgi:hypothetical protein